MWRCSDELRSRVQQLVTSAKKEAKHYIGNSLLYIYYHNQFLFLLSISPPFFASEFWKQIPPNEPFRVILGDVRDMLYNTRERMHQLLSVGKSDIPEDDTLTSVDQVCCSLRFNSFSFTTFVVLPEYGFLCLVVCSWINTLFLTIDIVRFLNL